MSPPAAAGIPAKPAACQLGDLTHACRDSDNPTMNHRPDTKEIVSQLERAGHKMTRPRREIVERITERNDRFTANDLLDAVASDGVGRATVFRTLDLLVQLGYLNRIHSSTDCATYTLCDGDHHHHLVCNTCGRVIPISEPAI